LTKFSGTLTADALTAEHVVVLLAGDVVTIRLRSPNLDLANMAQVDTVLILVLPDGSTIENDDCRVTRNLGSCIEDLRLEDGGVYRIGVDSYDHRERGDYELTVEVSRETTPTVTPTNTRTPTRTFSRTPTFTRTPDSAGTREPAAPTVAAPTTAPVNTADPPTQTVTAATTELPEPCDGLTEPLVVIPVSQINVREGPGTGFPLKGVVYEGDCFEIIGRNQTGTWLLLQVTPLRTGWVSASQLTITGDLDSVPVRTE
jgi:hypothetical protein